MAGAEGFEVDPEVLAAIEPLRSRHVSEVARLHVEAMGRSTWAHLGERFLEEVYRGLIADQDFLGWVFVEDGKVGGFIAGSRDASRMFRSVLIRRWWRLGVAALPGLLGKPSLALRLLSTPAYFAVGAVRSAGRRLDPTGARQEVSAESMFCSFEPHLRGRRIAGLINKVLFDELLARGHRRVRITTEADNLGANRQLRSWGFVDRGTFSFYGKRMREYVLDLATSDRVEPVSRHPGPERNPAEG